MQIADTAESQGILERCTGERAQTGPVTNYHNNAHKFAGESGTFYFSVFPCSQCRSGEIIGRREQLQRVDRGRERERGAGSTWSHWVSSHWSTGAFIITLATTYGNTTRRDCGHTWFWRTPEDPCGDRGGQISGTLHQTVERKAWHPKAASSGRWALIDVRGLPICLSSSDLEKRKRNLFYGAL